jgi:hypothetical protein
LLVGCSFLEKCHLTNLTRIRDTEVISMADKAVVNETILVVALSVDKMLDLGKVTDVFLEQLDDRIVAQQVICATLLAEVAVSSSDPAAHFSALRERILQGLKDATFTGMETDRANATRERVLPILGEMLQGFQFSK